MDNKKIIDRYIYIKQLEIDKILIDKNDELDFLEEAVATICFSNCLFTMYSTVHKQGCYKSDKNLARLKKEGK